jgi:hypothetical protein
LTLIWPALKDGGFVVPGFNVMGPDDPTYAVAA